MPNKIPKHIANLLLLLGCFFVLALAAKFYLTDPSFYKFGHYRADVVPELAAGEPVFRGSAYCQTCHSEGFAAGSGNAHGSVQCEVCHGVDPEHPDNPETRVPIDTIELCSVCHEAMPARPAAQPQIVLDEHPFPDKDTEQCHSCHDPHSPGDGETEESTGETGTQSTIAVDIPANLLDIVPKCAKCHGQRGEGRKRNPAIAGLESRDFIDLMNMYVSGAREHKAMANIATALSTEEIEQLSAYYGRLTAESTD